MKLREWFNKRFNTPDRQAELGRQLEALQKQTPVPVFWLFGKTQTGKTSIIKYLTGADDAEIGAGYKPTTRFSREYQFPTEEAPLLSFMDTRGLDEPGYDSAEDIAKFNDQAHVVVVTVRIMDHAQERVLKHLERIRSARRDRPIVLALTCLHEAYPQQQHVEPYLFADTLEPPNTPQDLLRSLALQRERFGGLVDVVVPIDLTRPEEGFNDPHYGGPKLKSALMDVLPEAYRQTLFNVEEATQGLRSWHERRALPYILGYSTLAGTVGAFPIPWADLLVLPGIQTQMIHHLARLYGQPLSGQRFLELASTLGLGMVFRQAVREVTKFIPGVGSVVSGALAGSSTYALGRAFCYYYGSVLAGHVPQAEDLKFYYQQQLQQAAQLWGKIGTKPGEPTTPQQQAG